MPTSLKSRGATTCCRSSSTAYRTQANEHWLRRQGKLSRIHRRKPRGRPLPERTAAANAAKSKVRPRIEHVFAQLKANPHDRHPPRRAQDHASQSDLQHAPADLPRNSRGDGIGALDRRKMPRTSRQRDNNCEKSAAFRLSHLHGTLPIPSNPPVNGGAQLRCGDWRGRQGVRTRRGSYLASAGIYDDGSRSAAARVDGMSLRSGGYDAAQCARSGNRSE